MSDDVWILGITMTKFGKHPDKEVIDLAADAATAALADGGVTMKEKGHPVAATGLANISEPCHHRRDEAGGATSRGPGRPGPRDRPGVVVRRAHPGGLGGLSAHRPGAGSQPGYRMDSGMSPEMSMLPVMTAPMVPPSVTMFSPVT